MSRTNFYGTKDVRAIEVLLYVGIIFLMVTSSAYVGEGIHEKERNAKMSRSNQQKKWKMWGVPAITPFCAFDFNFLLVILDIHSCSSV